MGIITESGRYFHVGANSVSRCCFAGGEGSAFGFLAGKVRAWGHGYAHLRVSVRYHPSANPLPNH